MSIDKTTRAAYDKEFAASMRGFEGSFKSKQQHLQAMIDQGFRLYLEAGDSEYLTQTYRKCFELKASAIYKVKAYILDHANLELNKDRAGQWKFSKKNEANGDKQKPEVKPVDVKYWQHNSSKPIAKPVDFVAKSHRVVKDFKKGNATLRQAETLRNIIDRYIDEIKREGTTAAPETVETITDSDSKVTD